MSNFVLVSGSWSGGWAWQGVARRLRDAGHLVYTPSLSGLAERAHVRTAEPVTLSTHIEDVVQFLYFEDLTKVVLVGWSYGGGVVDGVADLVPERLARVVNLDGEVAREGHLLSEGWTEEAQAEYQPVIQEAKRTGWIAPPSVLASIVDPVLNRWVLERERPQPVGTYTEPYPDRGSARYQVPHTFPALRNTRGGGAGGHRTARRPSMVVPGAAHREPSRRALRPRGHRRRPP